MGRPIDKLAMDRLVVEHLPDALRFATRLAGDAHLAEELVQESLCRVLRQWRSYRGEAAFKTWLFQIIVNSDRDRRRRARPLGVLSESAQSKEHSAAQRLVAEETRDAILAAIERLPDRQREVAVLVLGEGLDAGEAAGVLGISASNVYACLHHARRRIAEEIGVTYARPNNANPKSSNPKGASPKGA